MRRAYGATLALILVASICFAAGVASGATGQYLATVILSQAGSLEGSVFCGGGEGEMEPQAFAPRRDSMVWIRGTSFSSLTDQAGSFRIDYVPAGTYSVGVTTAGRMVRVPFVSMDEVSDPPAPTAGTDDLVTLSPRSVNTVYLYVRGGCGACGGAGGGGGGCEEGGCEG